MKYIYILSILFSILGAKDYSSDSNAIKCMDILVDKYDHNRTTLEKLFSDVTVQKSALRVFRPKIKTESKVTKSKNKTRKKRSGSWDLYSRFKTNPNRAQQGVNFIKKHQDTFNKVEESYGVPKEYIAAIIGIETVYGGTLGKYPVFDTLVTLAFEKNRRNRFFRNELIKFIHLAKTEKFNLKNVKGSYAGAIGLGQFMPSNYEAYGVDFNNDGKITLQKATDAIASIANYLKKNGWRSNEPVAIRVHYEGNRFNKYPTGYTKQYDRKELKGISPKLFWEYTDKVRLIKLVKSDYDELWYGAKNFFVITRYNHSSYYAMAVHQLAYKIKKKLNYEN